MLSNKKNDELSESSCEMREEVIYCADDEESEEWSRGTDIVDDYIDILDLVDPCDSTMEVRSLGVEGIREGQAVVYVEDDNGGVRVGKTSFGDYEVLSDYGSLWVKFEGQVRKVKGFPEGWDFTWRQCFSPPVDRVRFFSEVDLPNMWYSYYHMRNGFIHLISDPYDCLERSEIMEEAGVSFENAISAAQDVLEPLPSEVLKTVRLNTLLNRGAGFEEKEESKAEVKVDCVYVKTCDIRDQLPVAPLQYINDQLKDVKEVGKVSFGEAAGLFNLKVRYGNLIKQRINNWTCEKVHVSAPGVFAWQGLKVQEVVDENNGRRFGKKKEWNVGRGRSIVVQPYGIKCLVGVIIPKTRKGIPVVVPVCLSSLGNLRGVVEHIDNRIGRLRSVDLHVLPVKKKRVYHLNVRAPYFKKIVKMKDFVRHGLKGGVHSFRTVEKVVRRALKKGFFPKFSMAEVLKLGMIKWKDDCVSLGGLRVSGKASVFVKEGVLLAFAMYGKQGSIITQFRCDSWPVCLEKETPKYQEEDRSLDQVSKTSQLIARAKPLGENDSENYTQVLYAASPDRNDSVIYKETVSSSGVIGVCVSRVKDKITVLVGGKAQPDDWAETLHLTLPPDSQEYFHLNFDHE